MPYWELYVHLVWATRGRELVLDGQRRTIVDRTIRSVCREQGAIVHALHSMPDHVHLAVSVPPRLAVADLVRLVKGNTSHLLNHELANAERAPFAWQSEYGAVSFGKRSLDSVVKYVTNQETHHAENSIWPSFERMVREGAPAKELDS